MQKIEIYEKKPDGFKALVEVSGCYLEIDGKILLLQEGFAKRETGAWGVPAGKNEKQETPEAAAHRELFEETGIQIKKPTQIRSLGCLYIHKPELDYIYHLFQVNIENTPPVCISKEHQSFGWFSLQHINRLTLLIGAKEGLEYYQRWSKQF